MCYNTAACVPGWGDTGLIIERAAVNTVLCALLGKLREKCGNS